MNEDDTFRKLKKASYEEIDAIVNHFAAYQHSMGIHYFNASEEEIDAVLDPVLKPFGWTRQEYLAIIRQMEKNIQPKSEPENE